MTTGISEGGATIKLTFFGLLFMVVLPVVLMRLFVPVLKEHGPKRVNYRGASVYLGLGVYWAFLALGMLLTGYLSGFLAQEGDHAAWITVMSLSAPLIFAAFTFGFLDDTLGNKEQYRGFKGHFKALFHAKITTGMLKLIGIGIASLLTAVIFMPAFPEIHDILMLIVHTGLIALSANLYNLLDLRPARAHKSYVLGLVVLTGLGLISQFFTSIDQLFWAARALNPTDYALIALVAVSPIVACWQEDALERGMLGDAGANAMGAFLGFLACIILPDIACVLWLVILLALNALSERLSFSEVIEKTPWLRKLDQWGRP